MNLFYRVKVLGCKGCISIIQTTQVWDKSAKNQNSILYLVLLQRNKLPETRLGHVLLSCTAKLMIACRNSLQQLCFSFQRPTSQWPTQLIPLHSHCALTGQTPTGVSVWYRCSLFFFVSHRSSWSCGSSDYEMMQKSHHPGEAFLWLFEVSNDQFGDEQHNTRWSTAVTGLKAFFVCVCFPCSVFLVIFHLELTGI